MIQCRNCGAAFRSKHSKCGYCGTERVVERVEKPEAKRDAGAERQPGVSLINYINTERMTPPHMGPHGKCTKPLYRSDISMQYECDCGFAITDAALVSVRHSSYAIQKLMLGQPND